MKKILAAVGMGCVAVSAAHGAMQPLDDAGLADIQAQDGILIRLDAASIPVASARWHTDSGVTAVGSVTINPDTWGQLEGVSVRPIGNNGAAGPASLGASLTLDVGADSTTAMPFLGLTGQSSRARLAFDRLVHQFDTTRSVGTFALDIQPQFNLVNAGGPLNATDGRTAFLFDIGDGEFYYRQGAAGQPEALFDELSFRLSYTGGKLGADNSGLLLEAPQVDINAGFSLRYEAAPAAADAFTAQAGDLPVLHWSWAGKLTNFQTRIRGGGVWYGTDGGGVENIANRSEGLNFGLRWDYDPGFAWYAGEPGSRMRAVFGNWQKLSGAPYAFNFPNITLDIIKANQGPGGLCWRGTSNGPTCPGGGQFMDVPAEDNGYALLVRDGNLHAYSTGVRLLDDINNDGDYADTSALGTPEDQSFPWALIYTLGDVDANLYLYPGTTGSNTTGLKLDGLVKIQSNSSAWNSGSHYMIADTATPKGAGSTTLGIGFLRSNLLFAFNDLYLRLQSGGINLQSSQVRAAFRGRFGGGEITGGDLAAANEVKLTDVDANLEFSNFDITLSPAPSGQSFMGYSGRLRFADLATANFAGTDADGSYVSASEPGRQDVNLRLAQITGDIGLANGRVDLLPEAETAAGTPARTAQLKIGNDLLFGTTLSSGQVFQVGAIKFGGNNIGTLVIPSGQWHAAFALKKQGQ